MGPVFHLTTAGQCRACHNVHARDLSYVHMHNDSSSTSPAELYPNPSWR